MTRALPEMPTVLSTSSTVAWSRITTISKPSGDCPEMIIEMATSKEDLLSMRRIRQQVFEHEMGLTLPPLSAPEGVAAAHVIARVELTGEPVAALTVVDTTNEVDLCEQYS